MYRTVRLSIIMSLFTVHSAMVYVIQVCRQFESCLQTCMTYTIARKWTLCLAKSRDLHKSTKKYSTIMTTLRPYSSWTTWAQCADSIGRNLSS